MSIYDFQLKSWLADLVSSFPLTRCGRMDDRTPENVLRQLVTAYTNSLDPSSRQSPLLSGGNLISESKQQNIAVAPCEIFKKR